MKRRIVKRRIMRPNAAFLPAAGLIAALCGHSRQVGQLFFAFYLLQLASLCAGDCFRNAAAREPGVRRVEIRFSGALVQLLLGGCISAAVLQFALPGVIPWEIALAALLMCIEQTFEERMFALSRPVDGALLSGVAAVLLLAGLFLDSGALEAPMPHFYLFCGAGLGTIIAIISNYLLYPAKAFSLVPRNLSFAPRAMLQTLLYPALAIALFIYLPEKFGLNRPEPLLYGLIIWRLARSTCPRVRSELPPLFIMLLTTILPISIAAFFLHPLRPYAYAALLGGLCPLPGLCPLTHASAFR